MSNFTITARDSNARTGVIETAHGQIHTPAFVPLATKGVVKGLELATFVAVWANSHIRTSVRYTIISN